MAPAGCESAAECSNGDPTDGDEACVAGVCEAGDAPPRVVSSTPADDSVDVATDATITVTFSEPLDPESIDETTFQVFDGDTEVAGELLLESKNEQINFRPNAALELWTKYRVEIGHGVRDRAGVSMVEDVSFSFQVRDGAWAVTNLAQGEEFTLPVSLPVNASGAALAAWLTKRASGCSAAGAWVTQGQIESSERFGSAENEGGCGYVSASVAGDGGAVAGWAIGKREWSQSFAAGGWASAERQIQEVYDAVLVDGQVLAHTAQQMSLWHDINSKSGYLRFLDQGAARGAWSFDGRTLSGGSPLRFGVGADGGVLATWSHAGAVEVIAYEPSRGTWADDSTRLPGSSSSTSDRGAPNVAIAPTGDALVLWVEGANSQILRFSRLRPDTGWDAAPGLVSQDLSGAPLFDAPALVFDGRTFVSAWTSNHGGKVATYTARYDLHSGQWHTDDPHGGELGQSAGLMPRLGADSHGNLMLLWAIASTPTTLAYQRYRAETDTWESAKPIAGVSFTDAGFSTQGKLPFGFSTHGSGGVLFRSGSSGAQTLKLAQFF